MDVMFVSRAELKEVFKEALTEFSGMVDVGSKPIEHERAEPTFIKGIQGLASFLNVSISTAQRLKNAKIIPCIQRGRTVLFKPEDVIAGMSKKRRKV